MKILFISRTYPPSYGAQATQMERAAKALSTIVEHVSVITQADSILANERKNNIQNKHNVIYVDGEKKIYEGLNIQDRLRSKLYNELESINSKSLWVRNAVALVGNLIKAIKPDIILSAALPFESHLVALQIKKCFNIPWIAYFSDPWPKPPYPYNAIAVPLTAIYKFKLLREVFRNCDAIITPNEMQIDYMQKSAGVNISKKSYVVPPIGEEFKDIPVRPEYAYCLTHGGQLTKERASLPLLIAVKKLKYEDTHNYFDRLILVGNVCPKFKEMIKSTTTETIVHCFDKVSVAESYTIATNSKALLVIEANMRTNPFIPSKIADYAMTGRPILAITTKKSTIRDYFKKYGGGLAVNNDENEIYYALKQLFVKDDYKHDSLKLASQFKSVTVANKYIDIFRTAISKRN